MNIKYKIKTLLFIAVLIISVIQFESCKKQPLMILPATSSPPVLPQVLFWTQDNVMACLCDGDPISISIDSVTKILKNYHYGPPRLCIESVGTIRFDLKPGTHKWQAVRGIDTARGSVTISANSCMLQEVNF